MSQIGCLVILEVYVFITFYIQVVIFEKIMNIIFSPYFEQFFTHKKRKKIPEIGEISQFVRMSVLNMFITSDKIEENEYN